MARQWQWSGGNDGSVGATAAVTQGSVVVRTLLVRTGSCRRWCGSVRQGSATAAAEVVVQAGALAAALVAALVTAEAGRGKQKV